MKILIVSHVYLEPETRKNIHALSSLSDVRCALPSRAWVLVTGVREFAAETPADHGLFHPLRSVALFRSQFLLSGLRSVIVDYAPDVIVVEYNPWSAVFVQILAWCRVYLPRTKIVSSIKKNTYQRTGIAYIKDLIARTLMPHVDHIIAGSQLAANLYEKVLQYPRTQIDVCHTIGIDLDVFSPRVEPLHDQGPITIGYCGRFDAEKGVSDLITAVETVRRSCTRPLVLHLMGKGAYRDKLDGRIRALADKESWLRTSPPIPNAEVAAFMRGLDIFVLPARRELDHEEHDARALLEAMACGVACVGTRSGIIPEVLGDGSGELVACGCPEELARVLANLIEDGERRRRLAKAARAKAVRDFSLEVIAQRKLDILRKVINEHE